MLFLKNLLFLFSNILNSVFRCVHIAIQPVLSFYVNNMFIPKSMINLFP